MTKVKAQEKKAGQAWGGGFSVNRIYVGFSLLILLATTVFWSLLGADIHLGNADQLVNSYLFDSFNTFHNAIFPGAHSFLIKWPLFLIASIAGTTDLTFILLTVGVSIVTVAALACIIYRINSKPVIFGTLMLALASVLLLVPPVPYAGGILPVNMAMVATRNLEYVVYILSLAMLTRAPSFMSRWFWLAAFALGFLAASDKLFLTLSIGGAVAALVVYAFFNRGELLKLSLRWLVAALAAFVISAGLIWAINASGFTHIASGSESSPYEFARSLKTLALGGIFGLLGILTNFGANPAFDIAVLKDLPHQALTRLISPSGVSYLVNFGLALAGFFAAGKLFFAGLTRSKGKELDWPAKLSILLIWSSVAALAAFVATDHYHVVDARYLTVILFAVFISAATYLRNFEVKLSRPVVIVAVVLTGSIFLGIFSVVQTYKDAMSALSDVNKRDRAVVKMLKDRNFDTIVGDYWRVIPIKHLGDGAVNAMPLQSCTQVRDVLSSKSWQPNLNTQDFTYLLSLDKSLTNYSGCTFDQVVAKYGQPTDKAVISGTVENPTELLLFYDRSNDVNSQSGQQKPIGETKAGNIGQVLHSCEGKKTIMNIMAHEDDDLLFMSPDLGNAIKADTCIRSVYVTAGDAGNGRAYWQGREQGAKAAYDKMNGPKMDLWVDRTVKLSDNSTVIISNDYPDRDFSLIFLRLPDGNVDGTGFTGTGRQSLAKLEAGSINDIESVEKISTYTSDQLLSTLTYLMNAYQPTEIHTQATANMSTKYPDHSDHMAVGRYVRRAFEGYKNKASTPVNYYVGYPIHAWTANVSGADLDAKEDTFMAYAQFDGAVCHLLQQCVNDAAYGAYLPRQYQMTPQ